MPGAKRGINSTRQRANRATCSAGPPNRIGRTPREPLVERIACGNGCDVAVAAVPLGLRPLNHSKPQQPRPHQREVARGRKKAGGLPILLLYDAAPMPLSRRGLGERRSALRATPRRCCRKPLRRLPPWRSTAQKRELGPDCGCASRSLDEKRIKPPMPSQRNTQTPRSRAECRTRSLANAEATANRKSSERNRRSVPHTP